MSENRILLFDILRIAAILMVVLFHVGEIINIPLFTQRVPGPSGPDWALQGLAFGGWGVALFIFISGCVLEYNYGKKVWGSDGSFNFRSFIERRLLRIYPIYWFSIILILLVGSDLTGALSWPNLIKTISGFYPVFTLFGVQSPDSFIGGAIDPVGWFICAIVLLYLLFPLISRFLKNNGVQGLTLILIVAMFVRISLPIGTYGQISTWFPLSRMAEFALGIYIVQNGFYSKTINNSKIIQFLSDLCFPVFLVHYSVLYILTDAPKIFFANVILFTVVTLFLAILVYLFEISFMKLFGVLRKNWLITKKRDGG
jgi:peptidoglycan/LPS O-acetylase OafA/YrhL